MNNDFDKFIEKIKNYPKEKLGDKELVTGNRLFKISLEPSFGDGIYWELIKVTDYGNENKRFYLLKSYCENKKEMKIKTNKKIEKIIRFDDYGVKKSIIIAKKEIEEKEIHKLLNELNNIKINYYTGDGIWGKDGEMFELKVGDGFNTTTFKLWSHCPKEWNDLKKFIFQTIRYFEYEIYNEKSVEYDFYLCQNDLKEY